MKKTLVFLTAFLAGCGSQNQPANTTTLKNPDTYTYATISDIDSLDPAYAYDTASHVIFMNVYEFLVDFDGGSAEKLVPMLAEKVPSLQNGLVSKDGRTYRFPIRKGAKFHDGTPMTPEDVKYSLMRFMLQDRTAGPSSILLEPILGYASTRDEKGNIIEKAFKDADRAVQVEGDSVVVRLPKPYAPLLGILTEWAPILSKKWAAEHGDWDGTEASWRKYNSPKKESSYFFEHMNGTGPFLLERWDKKNKEIVLVRNDGYWREPAKLKRVVIKAVNEFATRKLMLTAGDADNIYADRIHFSQLQNIPGVEITDGLAAIEMNPSVFFTFKINPVANPDIRSGKLDGEGIPPDFFSDIDVRKGFAYAFDYGAFIRDAYQGKGTQATGCIPKTLPGHDPEAPKYSYDLKKAEEHFKKAHGGKVWERGFKFTLTYNEGNIPRQTLCQIIKVNVEKLNPKFKIDVRPMQWSTFLDAQINAKLPIFTLGWNADFPDAHNFAFSFLHSQGAFPVRQGYKNTQIDRLIEQAVAETNLEKRKKLYSRMLALGHEDVPHLVLIDAVKYRTQRNWVKGWYHNPVFPESPYSSYFYPIYKEGPGAPASM